MCPACICHQCPSSQPGLEEGTSRGTWAWWQGVEVHGLGSDRGEEEGPCDIQRPKEKNSYLGAGLN